MLDKTNLSGCCLMIKDHNAMDFKHRCGFEAMSNAQEHSDVQVFYVPFKQ